MLFLSLMKDEKPFNLSDEQAFEANQRGEITQTQKNHASTIINWTFIFTASVMIVIFGAGAAVAFRPVIDTGDIDYLFVMEPIWLILGSVFLVFLLLIVVNVLSQTIKLINIRRDLAENALYLGQGQLIHKADGYVFDMDGYYLQLHLNASVNNGLLPGVTYRVYYLERSKFLLSAKATEKLEPAKILSALDSILASANGYTDEDLLDNQDGKITRPQYVNRTPYIISGFAALAIGLLFIFTPSLRDSSDQLVPGLSSLMTIAGIIILLIVGIVRITRSTIDVIRTNPEYIEGKVYKGQRTVQRGKNSHVEYYYQINEQRFTVNYSAYTALIDGLGYRIYYHDGSKKLISIKTLKAT